MDRVNVVMTYFYQLKRSRHASLSTKYTGSSLFTLLLAQSLPQDGPQTASAIQEVEVISAWALGQDTNAEHLEARQIIPIFRGVGGVYTKYRTSSLPQPTANSIDTSYKPSPPSLEGSDREKELDFNGRECKVGLYQNPWFRNTAPGYGWRPYARWEGYPLGRRGDQIQKEENCFDVEDLNPELKDQTRYAVVTGHCGCQFYSKPGCSDDSWLFSGHDVDGEVPSRAWTKTASFRCRNNNHVDDFQSCKVTFTNGGDEWEPNGKYNLYFNVMDGYPYLTFWYQDLYYDRSNITEDQDAGGSLCWATDSLKKQREDGMAQFIRYGNATGCSCTVYRGRTCSGEVLREVGGYGTDVQYNWPSTNYIQPGSVRCWPPYGLNHGKRADGLPERQNWGFET
ncbi:hypothetical protein TWF225_002282 [Orbilia oligospora]|nr:hypothetical protein TWF225_002282 [Orbilia oligospora]KAF3240507.1 hypothetical protein TWF217_000795 [Orbilia oligospora]